MAQSVIKLRQQAATSTYVADLWTASRLPSPFDYGLAFGLLLNRQVSQIADVHERVRPSRTHSLFGTAKPDHFPGGSPMRTLVTGSAGHWCMQGIGRVLHVATVHKPHIATHARQEFVDTNITGTLNLLEESVAAGSFRWRCGSRKVRTCAEGLLHSWQRG
jgi:hypothetical protein